ncbi:transposase [Streptosporangium sp. NBC_01810]|uniref:transposase n=1 Tax=Streptosporangium sp. NBC_01810 TaxID=2975951 RepID=UPI002DDB1E6C|nr:transposase [Streptosporangium sp. NBC_01810]WSA29522.1 transposase [Streptosporangium sp. NBC_01810]
MLGSDEVEEKERQHRTEDRPREDFAEGDLEGPGELSAQMAVRSIAKACEAYKRDKTIKPAFRELGAVAYDQRILTWKGPEAVSLLTLSGRVVVPLLYRGRWLNSAGAVLRGQADLVYRDGVFFLAVVVEVPAPPPGEEPKEWLGVDLGIVNLATDSTGKSYSGKGVRAVRRRNARLRARLQAKGTKSAKRLLKRRRSKESRFARDVNHVIAKQLVGKAKDTRAGIALEGIRERVTVRKAQRADLHSWGFHQLRTFVAYKAALAGVAVRLVDPRNTSRTCPGCGHLDKLTVACRLRSDRFRSLSQSG